MKFFLLTIGFLISTAWQVLPAPNHAVEELAQDIPELRKLSALKTGDDCVVEVFDQRQNGTENYRIKIDDVLLIVAPGDSLGGLGEIVDEDYEFGGSQQDGDSVYVSRPTVPKPENSSDVGIKVTKPKP